MMIEQHYDEEVLIGMLDEQKPDLHLDSCETCTSALNSIRQVTSTLHDETVWDRRELSEEPRPATRDALRSLASSAAAEDTAAEPWVKALLAKAASEWRATVDSHPEWRTAGFVRRLVAAVDAINFTAPTDAVELMRVAVDVAEGLEGNSKLKATAWREYGYALNYLGSHVDALVALDRAEAYLSASSVNEYERARVQLVRATALSSMEHLNDAMVAARSARTTFTAFGDARRARIAAMAEGGVLMSAHRFADALPLHLSVMNDSTADETSRACALHNAAACYRAMSQLSQAKNLFVQAVAAYERLGLVSFRAKARWNFASVLLADGQFGAAVQLFAEVRTELQELGLAHSLALASVDMAEALLLAGRPNEVSDLCRSAIEYFRTASLSYTEGAMAALAYLRESADNQALTVAAVNDVRAFFEILPKQPGLLFARPA